MIPICGRTVMIPIRQRLRERHGEVARLTAGYRESIKSHDLLVEPVFKACRFNFSLDETIMLDAMSGPGGLGLELLAMFDRQRPPGNRSELAVMFNDVREKPIDQIHAAFPDSFGSFTCKVRNVACPVFFNVAGNMTYPVFFNVAVVRYGLTELPRQEQESALAALRTSLLSGGRLVVADMTAYDANQQAGIMTVQSARQEFAGRDVATEGTGHIPTMVEWKVLLRKAGFQNVKLEFTGAKDVSVSQWADEFGDDFQMKIRVMNRIISETAARNPWFKNGCGVDFGHTEANLKLPVMVVAGDNPG